MNTQRISFPCGNLNLEGILTQPSETKKHPAIIVCHPHPLHGGNMDNSVVSAVCNTLDQLDWVTLKFNFRGVGNSLGKHDNGIGEQNDVSAAIDYICSISSVDLNNVHLAGYSAGGAYLTPVGIKDKRIKSVVIISPPLTVYPFSELVRSLKPKYVICGNEDEFAPVDKLMSFCHNLTEYKECEIINGVDHFWSGLEEVLANKVKSYLIKIHGD